jgi:hypothetical protein
MFQCIKLVNKGDNQNKVIKKMNQFKNKKGKQKTTFALCVHAPQTSIRSKGNGAQFVKANWTLIITILI